MIGPGAERELFYRPLSPVGRSSAGIPKWRILAVFIGALVLLSNLPKGGPQAVQADSYAGAGTPGCTTADTVLASYDVQGYNSGEIAFHLTIPTGGTVTGRWEHSSGYGWPAVTLSAGTAGNAEWWITGAGGGTGTFTPALAYTIAAGSTGTMRFIIGKVASYGGCYRVDNVLVVRHRQVDTVPGTVAPAGTNGLPSLNPTPSTSYPPQPSGSPAPGSTFPPGWCWISDDRGGVEEGTWVQCEAPPPSAAPGLGAPAFTLQCQYTWPTANCTQTTANGSIPVGGVYVVRLTLTVRSVPAHMTANITLNAGNPGATYGRCSWVFGAGVSPGAAHDCEGVVMSQPSPGNYLWLNVSGMDPANWGAPTIGARAEFFQTGGPGYSPDPSFNPYPSPSGWPSYPPLPTFGGFGTMPPFSWPSYPPFSWPSLPLFSPDPSAGPGGVNICPTNAAGATPPIAACVTTPSANPSGPGSSFSLGVPNPSAQLSNWSQLLDDLGQKAPFGYAAQAIGAIDSAAGSAAGAGLDSCVSVPLWHPGGSSSVPWCIPWDDVAGWAAPIRFVLLAVLLIGVAFAFISIARSTAAGGN